MMRLLSVIDSQNYEFNYQVKMIEAVRAVIFSRGKLLMLKSNLNGYYTFPGGKREEGEELTDCLIRETSDETGYLIIDKTIKELGYVIVIDKDEFREETINNTKNYYYMSEVKSISASPYLKDYEIEEGLTPVFVDIEEAYNTNQELLEKINKTFLYRDNAVLKYLLENKKIYTTKK